MATLKSKLNSSTSIVDDVIAYKVSTKAQAIAQAKNVASEGNDLTNKLRGERFRIFGICMMLAKAQPKLKQSEIGEVIDAWAHDRGVKKETAKNYKSRNVAMCNVARAHDSDLQSIFNNAVAYKNDFDKKRATKNNENKTIVLDEALGKICGIINTALAEKKVDAKDAATTDGQATLAEKFRKAVKDKSKNVGKRGGKAKAKSETLLDCANEAQAWLEKIEARKSQEAQSVKRDVAAAMKLIVALIKKLTPAEENA